MAKSLRLTNNHRHLLVNHAKSLVQRPVEQKAYDAARKRIVDFGLAFVEKHYPAKEMEILRKYDCAQGLHRFHFRYGARRFDLSLDLDSDPHPLVPSSCYYSLDVRDTPETLINRAHDTRVALDKARDVVLEDYNNLIFAARTLKDVSDVWPEALDVIREPDAPLGNLPTTITEDVIERIKQDCARRAHKKAA